MAAVRIACWNLHWPSRKKARILGELLRDHRTPDVAVLQEANPETLDDFCEAAGLGWWDATQTSFDDLLAVRGRDGAGQRRRPRGVAIAGTGERLRSPVAFPDIPLPEKVLAGWVDIGGQRVTVVSYHAPTGVQHREKKPAQAVRLARWLADIDGPVIFGGDFNTPKTDHLDHAQIRTHWHSGDRHLRGAPGDDLLVGPNEMHALRDALRLWLTDHPTELDAIAAERPDGPLRVSHRTGSQKNPRRYDAIWVSPHFAVSAVEYLYDDALAAGSDHALVLADLDLLAA